MATKIIGTTDAGNNIIAIDLGFGDVWEWIRVDNDLWSTDDEGRWVVQSENSDGIYEAVSSETYATQDEATRLADLLIADGHPVRVKQI